MRIGTVSGLWRYPVKSTGGERLESAAITWRGIPGDRGWAVYDELRRGWRVHEQNGSRWRHRFARWLVR